MEEEVFQPEGNYYDKYGSKNPIVKMLMRGFFNAMDDMLKTSKIGVGEGTCIEAGCGEGNVTEHMAKWILRTDVAVEFTAFDISQKLIDENIRRYPAVKFFVHNIYESIDTEMLPSKGRFDLIVCSEVLEHMEEPAKAVKNLMNYGEKFIFSVPHEPVWRAMNMARGKYLNDFGNTPGHIQHYSVESFVSMLKRCGLKVVELRKPLPWIMVYCEKEH